MDLITLDVIRFVCYGALNHTKLGKGIIMNSFTLEAETLYGTVVVRKDNDGEPIICFDEDDFIDGGTIIVTTEEFFRALAFESEEDNKKCEKAYNELSPCPEKIQWMLDNDYISFDSEFKKDWGMSMADYVKLHQGKA